MNDARNGIKLVDTSSGAGNLIVANADATDTADALKIAVNDAVDSINSGSLAKQTVSRSTLLSSLNGGAGVAILHNAVGAYTLSGNSIFDNGGLGIDLSATLDHPLDGVTPNDARDADAGPDRLQNFPVITRAVHGAGATTTAVAFTLESEASRAYTVDFYSSPVQDPSGFGEGKKYLRSARVTTDGTGHAGGVVTLPATGAGEFITATATPLAGTSGGTGGTSEFSAARLVTDAPPLRASAADVAAVRRAVGATDAALLAHFDFTADGRIDAADVAVARASLVMGTPPRSPDGSVAATPTDRAALAPPRRTALWEAVTGTSDTV